MSKAHMAGMPQHRRWRTMDSEAPNMMNDMDEKQERSGRLEQMFNFSHLTKKMINDGTIPGSEWAEKLAASMTRDRCCVSRVHQMAFAQSTNKKTRSNRETTNTSVKRRCKTKYKFSAQAQSLKDWVKGSEVQGKGSKLKAKSPSRKDKDGEFY